MDGTAAIQNNLEALKRILAGLFAMIGDGFTSPLRGGRREASGGGCDGEETPTRRSDGHRPPRTGEVTLPRHLRLAILRLLRPAESAARRLIIAAARGLTVTLPPPRHRKPKPPTAEPFLRRFGIAVVLPANADPIPPRERGRGTVLSLSKGGGRGGLGATSATGNPPTTGPHPEVLATGEPRRTALPLCDPTRRILSLSKGRTCRPVPAHAAPRIMLPGYTQPHRLPAPPSLDDPIDCTRLNRRLAALAAALDDLPGHARRFARWQARRHRQLQRANASPSPLWGGVRGGGMPHSPLRPGRPPGGRLSRFDPSARLSSRIREVDEILAHAHALALHALEHPDTS